MKSSTIPLLLTLLVVVSTSYSISIDKDMTCLELAEMIIDVPDDLEVLIRFTESYSVTGGQRIDFPKNYVVEIFGQARMNTIDCLFGFPTNYNGVTFNGMNVVFNYDLPGEIVETSTSIQFVDCFVGGTVEIKKVELDIRASEFESLIVYLRYVDDFEAVVSKFENLEIISEESNIDSFIRLLANDIQSFTFSTETDQNIQLILERNDFHTANVEIRDSVDFTFQKNTVDDSISFFFDTSKDVSTITNNSFATTKIETMNCICINFAGNYFPKFYNLIQGCIEMDQVCTDETCDNLVPPVYIHKDINCDPSHIVFYIAAGIVALIVLVLIIVIIYLACSKKDDNPYELYR